MFAPTLVLVNIRRKEYKESTCWSALEIFLTDLRRNLS